MLSTEKFVILTIDERDKRRLSTLGVTLDIKFFINILGGREQSLNFYVFYMGY